jgi:hypothetical protein
LSGGLEPGLDGRHRDRDGTISEKHGNTRVDTLRQTYGDKFVEGICGDAKLSTVLQRAAVGSLSQLLKKDKYSSFVGRLKRRRQICRLV